MEIRWTLRQRKYQSINREDFQDADFAREEGIQSDNVDNSLKKRQKKQNQEKKNQLYCTQQGQIYKRKFQQGWELHEVITEANNLRMKKIFEGAQGHILEEEEELIMIIKILSEIYHYI